MSTDLAWAAGFWDGEGCVSVTYRQYSEKTPRIPRLVVQVAQVDRRVLDRFCKIIGYGKVLGPYKQTNPRAKDYHVWRVEGNLHLQKIRDLLAPYLSEVKLQQMDDGLLARKTWEDTAKCFVHKKRLTVTSRGTWRCVECLSQSGKKGGSAHRKGKDGGVDV